MTENCSAAVYFRVFCLQCSTSCPPWQERERPPLFSVAIFAFEAYNIRVRKKIITEA